MRHRRRQLHHLIRLLTSSTPTALINNAPSARFSRVLTATVAADSHTDRQEFFLPETQKRFVLQRLYGPFGNLLENCLVVCSVKVSSSRRGDCAEG